MNILYENKFEINHYAHLFKTVQFFIINHA